MKDGGYQHKGLAAGGWAEKSLIEQMANIGSEFYRALSWKKKENEQYCMRAFERGLELIDLTVASCLFRYSEEPSRRRAALRELLRLREALCDYFVGDNEFGFDAEAINRYFYHFAIAQRR